MAHASPDYPDFQHISVLPVELIDGLRIQPNGHYLDLTLGGGGHTALILRGAADTVVWGVDQDASAIAATRAHLAPYITEHRLQLHHLNFAQFTPGPQRFDGIIADLGVSSVQLDLAERGFSFRQEAPLDMRMDPRQSLTAAEIVNQWDEQALADLIYQYGEERRSRRIARHILAQRPFATTTELAYTIAGCFPPNQRHGRIHPATRTFQALRIAVNQELKMLEQLLRLAPAWLKPGGRLGIISFHSLEDRRVKYAFKENHDLRVVTKKPIVAAAAEMERNPRSRSAKLRFAERKLLESEPSGEPVEKRGTFLR
ncbi:MAG: 16S rRNA (cytosine(1402)-N(4))-methyltransferase RsmH [Synechococcales cyanobacterium RU_4_20]|nr:16S rRNA (cytosine(1402)-N(4))-methyltransferase RsmH [Synechococcales cyanobacterium RU_4_20]NJR68371.1 16S rRNA (cytosine(1402)-N(4))-methyltransferase RsmH [Synechococcales cyanobacterium CRU_2_2]